MGWGMGWGFGWVGMGKGDMGSSGTMGCGGKGWGTGCGIIGWGSDCGNTVGKQDTGPLVTWCGIITVLTSVGVLSPLLVFSSITLLPGTKTGEASPSITGWGIAGGTGAELQGVGGWGIGGTGAGDGGIGAGTGYTGTGTSVGYGTAILLTWVGISSLTFCSPFWASSFLLWSSIINSS